MKLAEPLPMVGLKELVAPKLVCRIVPTKLVPVRLVNPPPLPVKLVAVTVPAENVPENVPLKVTPVSVLVTTLVGNCVVERVPIKLVAFRLVSPTPLFVANAARPDGRTDVGSEPPVNWETFKF